MEEDFRMPEASKSKRGQLKSSKLGGGKQYISFKIERLIPSQIERERDEYLSKLRQSNREQFISFQIEREGKGGKERN